MTQSIHKGQIIAGYPVLEIRRLMRALRCQESVSAKFPAGVLKVSAPAAEELTAQLVQLGYLQVWDVWKDTTWYAATPEQGVALSIASAARRITRESAERSLDGLLARIREVNANSYFLYKVSAAVVFGSYLSTCNTLGDVDVAIQLTPRYKEQEEFSRRHHDRIEEAMIEGRRFRNHCYEIYWPYTEVEMFLKARKRSVQFITLDHLSALAREKPPLRYRVLVGDKAKIRSELGPSA